MLHVYAVQGSLNLYTNTIVQSRFYVSSPCNTFRVSACTFSFLPRCSRFLRNKRDFLRANEAFGFNALLCKAELESGNGKNEFYFHFFISFRRFPHQMKA